MTWGLFLALFVAMAPSCEMPEAEVSPRSAPSASPSATPVAQASNTQSSVGTEAAEPADLPVPDKPEPPGKGIRAGQVERGTLLHELIRKGRCYRNDEHGFAVCTMDSKNDKFTKGVGPFLVGHDGKLHLTVSAGGHSRGKGVASGFQDASKFSFRRPQDPKRSFLDTVQAPSYVRVGDRRFLACGKALLELTAMPIAESRKLMNTSELFFLPPTFQVVARRADDGTFIVQVRGGYPSWERKLYIGRRGRVRLVKPIESHMMMDGGTLVFELRAGGKIFIPANLGEPDGSGGTYKPFAGAPEQALHVLSAKEMHTIEAELGLVTEGTPGHQPPCSAALGG